MPDIYIIHTWHKYHSCPIPISFIPGTSIIHARYLYHSYLIPVSFMPDTYIIHTWYMYTYPSWPIPISFIPCTVVCVSLVTLSGMLSISDWAYEKNTKCVQKISPCIDQPVVRIHVKELTRNKTSYVMKLLISDLKSVVIYLTRSICVC